MPALANVTDTLRIQLDYLLAPGLVGGSRFYVEYTGGPPTTANCLAIAGEVNTLFAGHLASLLSNNCDLQAVTVRDLNSSSGAEATDTTLVGGGRAGAPVSLQTAALLDFTIARRYRGGKPRMYTPFGIVTDLNASTNAWIPAFTASMVTNWNAFMTALLGYAGGGVTMTNQVNVGYYHGFTVVTNPITGRSRNVPTPKAGPITPDAIVSVGARTLIGSQRRRRQATTF